MAGRGSGKKRALRASVVLMLLLASLSLHLRAQPAVDSLLRVLPAHSGKDRARTLADIAYGLSASDAAKAKYYADEAVVTAVATGDSGLVAQCVNDLALIEHRLGHFHRAIDLNHRALRIRTTLKDTLGIAASHSKIGAAWVELMGFDSAIVHNQAAERVYHQLGDVVREAMVRGNQGRLYEQMGDTAKAELVTRDAVRLAKTAGHPSLLANAYAQLAIILQEQGKSAEAVPTARTALELLGPLGQKSEMASMYGLLGTEANTRGDRATALASFTEALRLSEEANDVSAVAVHLANVADMQLAMGYTARGMDMLERSVAICERERYVDQLLWGLERLVKAYRSTGNDHAALDRFEQLVHLKDSIYQRDRVAALSDMEVKYETERTENDLLAEKARTETQQRELSQQRLRMFVLAGSALLLVLIAALVLVVVRERHKSQLDKRMIAEREQGLRAMVESTDAERKRIAAELHDGVGQLLTGLKFRMEALAVRHPEVGGLLPLADDAGKEVRGIAHRMMPRALEELGLVPALTDMLNSALTLPGLHHTFDHFGMEGRWSAELERGVYRIAQELVNNVIKHASATNVSVQLLASKGSIVLSVEDDGIGIDPAAAAGGFGMRSLHDRARMLHGTFHVEAISPKGTRATLRVPMQPHP